MDAKQILAMSDSEAREELETRRERDGYERGFTKGFWTGIGLAVVSMIIGSFL